MEKEHDELVQDYQEGKISLVDFIEAQEIYREDWVMWLEREGRAKDEKAAHDFLSWVDNDLLHEF